MGFYTFSGNYRVPSSDSPAAFAEPSRLHPHVLLHPSPTVRLLVVGAMGGKNSHDLVGTRRLASFPRRDPRTIRFRGSSPDVLIPIILNSIDMVELNYKTLRKFFSLI